jgi:hypothetical protein
MEFTFTQWGGWVFGRRDFLLDQSFDSRTATDSRTEYQGQLIDRKKYFNRAVATPLWATAPLLADK